MICPNCHAEFREGFTTCSDCEIPLVEDLAAAAAAAKAGAEDDDLEAPGFAGGFGGGLGSGSGDPGDLVPLAELGSPEMLGTLLEQLEEAQIPYVVQAGTALALAYGRDLESPGFPDPWLARVMVVGSFRRRRARWSTLSSPKPSSRLWRPDPARPGAALTFSEPCRLPRRPDPPRAPPAGGLPPDWTPLGAIGCSVRWRLSLAGYTARALRGAPQEAPWPRDPASPSSSGRRRWRARSGRS